jgi:hypothetical protein
MKYVYSTSSTNFAYGGYSKAPKGSLPTIERRIVIRGGSNVMNANFMTPIGVMTKVSDEEAEYLMADKHFLRHMEAGFVKISDKNHDPEAVAADMESRDKSAPLTPADFEKPPVEAPAKAAKK